MFYANITMIAGTILFAYTTAAVSSILVTNDSDRSSLKKMSRPEIFRWFNISSDLGKRLQAYMKVYWETPNTIRKQDWSDLITDFHYHYVKK